MATAAQIEANRRNAQKSTGPKTEQGKARSRRNALKHGMAAVLLLPEQDEAAADARANQWCSSLKPWDSFEMWLLELAARESLRVERCAREESAIRASAAARAEVCWDDDRRLDAELLGQALAARPAEAKLTLERTPQGCAWLAARWGELLASLDVLGPWDDARRARALDLQGVALEARPVATPALPSTPEGSAMLARAEIARLEGRREVLAEVDGRHRDLAECGMGPEVEVEVRLVRRYERSSLRRLEWAIAQLQRRGVKPYPHPDTIRPRDADRRFEPAPPPPAPHLQHLAPRAASAASLGARTEPILADLSVAKVVASPAAFPAGPTLASAIPAPPAGNRRERRARRRGAA